MKRQVTSGHTTDEAQAIAEIEKLGMFPVVRDIPPANNDFHWHDFDSVFYVLEGQLDVTDHETGEVITIKAGDRAEADRGYVHREKHNGFKAVFGFTIDPATLEFPLEKALPVTA